LLLEERADDVIVRSARDEDVDEGAELVEPAGVLRDARGPLSAFDCFAGCPSLSKMRASSARVSGLSGSP